MVDFVLSNDQNDVTICITRNKNRITGRLKNGCVWRQVGLLDENGVAAYRLVCENVKNAQL